MREIKFRGKDEDTGEWRYGGYHKHQITEICPVQFYGESEEDKTPKYIHYIIMDGFADWNMEKPILKSNVIAETVGLYTGLKDINGKEIYDGDIVKTNIDLIGVVSFDLGYYLDWIKEDKILMFNKDIKVWCNDWGLEVIGNIYENPDLLGE
jgi:uncharacterized phage protein (TIGR01671 family)